jgi:hypothetical protein
MKVNVTAVADIPCFKCLFWEWKKDSHLYCNPNECEKLTEWLIKEAENCQKNEDAVTVLATPTPKVVKNPKQ